MKHFVLAGASALALVAALSGTAHAADCPAITVADDQGITGEFPQQFELAEFQEKAGCTLTFQENPEIGALNGEIQGNPELPPLAERLPAEPLVVSDSYGWAIGSMRSAGQRSDQR
ncbi:MAG: hypothetical protein AAFX62_07655, partial [Pseudomonadota bacterium]